MSYHLEGRLLEVCNCRVLCPCWIGEDPDYKTCDTIVAWHFDKGSVDGVDVFDGDVTGRGLILFKGGEEVVPVLRKEFDAVRPAHVPDAPTHESLVAARDARVEVTV